MENWKRDLASLALFGCIGPLLGMAFLGMIGSGISGLLTPLLFIIFLAFAREAGLYAYALFLMAPALLAGLSYLFARRAGRPLLLIPATVAGGWAGLLFLDRVLGDFPTPDAKWLLVAALTSATLVLLDAAARRWGNAARARRLSLRH